jgi:uncharacterized protein YlxP (DUF503 family)
MTHKIKGLKDSPIKVDNYDALGLNDYAEALSDFILFTDTPMTLGIQGDWGSGKSSLMYLIEKKIKADSQAQEKNVHTMWFNTWQFSQFNLGDKLSISLLSRFIEELESLTVNKKSHQSGAKEALQWIIAGAVDIVGADQIARKMLEEATLFKAPSENIADLQTQLIELVDMTLTDANVDRVVVFIDDLDRLIPQKAVELLEALKLFLDIEGCVYVIACDYQIIVQGLKQKFGISEAELKGRSFFDKIIQVPFQMPVNQYRTERFCKTMLEHIGVAHTKEDVTLYLELIHYSVGFNPRTVKRLFNNLLLLKLVLEKKKVLKADKMAQINERMRILFATQCLQNTFSSLYNYLHNYLQKVTKPQTVVNEVNQLLTELREPETLRTASKFAKLWQDIKTDELFFNKLAHFMGTFLAAIQLKSDSSKNADKNLNADEILVLKTIMSFSAMVQGLKQKFGISEAELKGRSFFDKIIQVPFQMPVNQYRTERFCKTMLEHIGVAHTKEDVTLYLELIHYSVGFNPRTVKRLFNNLLLLKLVLEKKKVLKADKMAQINERMRILFATQCLQNTFSSLYNYLHNYLQKVTKPQTVVNEVNQLLTELREPETLRTASKFAKLWQDIKTDELFFNKLAHFMGTFLAAIQLKSDSSKNADKNLNADEILVLKTIMSFSAMVSVQEPPAQSTTIHPDIDTIRRFNNQLFKNFLTEIEKRYKKELKQLAAIIPAGFKKYQPRKTGGSGLFIEMRLKIVPANEEQKFSLALALDAGSSEYADNGEPQIWHYLYDYYIEDFEPWFEKHLRDIFPTVQTEHDDWGYLLYHKPFPSQTPRTELDNIFKQSAFNILDSLLLRLVQLHNESKL